MNKKLIITLATTMLSIAGTVGHAQLQKGNMLVGANLADMYIKGQNNNTEFSFSISPKVGYFIKDNVAIGGELLLGINGVKKNTNFSYGIGAFGRYYISDPNSLLLKHSRWFFEANVGIRGDNTYVKDGANATTNGLGLGIGPGLAYFLTPNISIEGLAKYNLIAGFGNSATSHKFGVSVGFQIYLPSNKAKNLYDEVKDEVKHKSN